MNPYTMPKRSRIEIENAVRAAWTGNEQHDLLQFRLDEMLEARIFWSRERAVLDQPD